MTKDEKTKVIQECVGVFSSPGVYLLDFKGLSVLEITNLRSQLRAADVSMQVVKNTLALRALKEVGIESLDEFLVGPTGLVWSKEDSAAPARIILKFIKETKKGVIKAGLVDGTLALESQMDAISKLPTKHELYGTLAGTLNAPIAKLARVLNALPVKFVRTIDAVRQSKSEEDAE